MIFNVENDNIIRIFLSSGDIFTVDTYEGIETKRHGMDNLPDYFSFWAEAINGEKQDVYVQIVGTVDNIVAVETMALLESDL
tara:strand:- start:297 stop:542 length:246 start_codon:yes stop_codon:yes gene_type:complete